jgi:heme-degrading monooxygenase HmoA
MNKMITRIFRVRVPRQLHQEFENKFLSISVPYVTQYPGLISLTLGRPILPHSEEYMMISLWESLAALAVFAGQNCDRAIIPEGMEKYVEECWVHQYEVFGD